MNDKITRTFSLGVESNYDSAGRLHNLEGHPAIVNLDSGRKEYYRHGLLHREDGPAIDHPEKLKVWALNGRPHRVDGPAVLGKDFEEYWFNGERHRTDGPAIIKRLPSGAIEESYYLHGRLFENEGFWRQELNRISPTDSVEAAPKKKKRGPRKPKIVVEAPPPPPAVTDKPTKSKRKQKDLVPSDKPASEKLSGA